MKPYLILIILLSWLAACGRLERKPEQIPTPTLAPTQTTELTDKQMGPLLPPTVTQTESKKPKATATTEPIATRTPRVQAKPHTDSLTRGTQLPDGWIRYRVPESKFMIELPNNFVVIQINENTLDEVMRQVEALFPDIAEEIDLHHFFEQNIRLLALDQQEVQQTEGQFAPNITLSVIPVGDTPLEALLLLNRAEMRKQGALNLSEPQSLSSYGRAQASIIDYDLPIGETTTHGRQLYLLANQTLHIMTASHLPNRDYSALLDEIISRIAVVEG